MMAELKNKEHYRKILCLLIPLGGVAFLLWYIKNSTCDVVYSDYIRLVNSYLPDVYDPRRFFVPDVLTRIPINYLERIINVELFGFSITFDRVLGAVSLGLAAWAFGVYFIRRRLGTVWFLLTMAVMFSLNKWEMITNGSGWSHFFAFACFYYHELVFDRVWAGEEKRGDTLQLILLPFLIILGTAGPYCAIYAVVMILSAAAGILRARIRKEGSSSRRYLVFLFAPLHPQQFLCRRGTRRSYGPFSGSAVSGCTVLSSEIYPQISGGNGDWGRRTDPVDRKGTDDRQYLLSVRSVCSSRLSLGAVAVSSAPSV